MSKNQGPAKRPISDLKSLSLQFGQQFRKWHYMPLLVRVGILVVGIALLIPDQLLASTMLLVVYLIIQGPFRSTRIKYSSFITIFRMTVGVFLIGRLFVVSLFNYRDTNGVLGTNFEDPGVVARIILILWVFLAGMDVGTSLVSRFQESAKLSFPTISSNEQYQSAKIVATIVFVLSTPIVVFYNIRIANFVAENSIYDYYLQRGDLLTLPHQLAEASFFLSFAILLATHPTFRQVIALSLIFGIANISIMQTGRRAPLILSALMVIGYGIWRDKRERDEGKRFLPKWFLPAVGLAIIPLVFVMNRMYASRGMNNAGNPSNLLDQVFEFLYSQGVSVNLLGYVQETQLNPPSDRSFLLGPIVESVGRQIGAEGWDAASRSGANADHSWKLDDFVSYSVMPELYLKGAGYGSSIVAESYADGGLILTFISGIAIILAIWVITRLIGISPVIGGVALLLLRELMFTARAPVATALLAPFDASGVLAILCLVVAIIVVTRLIKRGVLKPVTPTWKGCKSASR